MALVPWPEDSQSINSAAQLIAHVVFGDGPNLTHRATALRLGPVVAALIQRRAPGAPPEVKDEALLRLLGWLAERNPDLNVRVGGLSIRKRRGRGEVSGMIHSGALALLSPWIERRAGRCE